MAKGYWIVRVDVSNPDGYKAYVGRQCRRLQEIRRAFLVRGGKFESPEGGSRARNVVIEFPSYAGRARLLELAGVSGGDQAARAALRPPISSSSRATTARSRS